MSVEQWAVLALLILVPLLEGVARLRRTRVGDDAPSDRIAQVPTPPQPASDAAVPLGPLPASQAPVFKASRSLAVHRRVERPLSGDALVQWLRPSRNLRRAIVVATILGPPAQ
jgi:hypothetical protein